MQFLQWAQRILAAAAFAALGYCGLVLADTWNFQKAEQRQLEILLARPQTVPAAEIASPPPVSGDLIGRLDIARLGLSTMVMEGTGRTILRRAAGHIAGTARPGEPGNIGISGHRDSLFRPLRNILPGDIITLTTPLGEYQYRVMSTKVVGPLDVAVLDPSGEETLTLVTCYPFYFVGSAPNRFIVRAERIGKAS